MLCVQELTSFFYAYYLFVSVRQMFMRAAVTEIGHRLRVRERTFFLTMRKEKGIENTGSSLGDLVHVAVPVKWLLA